MYRSKTAVAPANDDSKDILMATFFGVGGVALGAGIGFLIAGPGGAAIGGLLGGLLGGWSPLFVLAAKELYKKITKKDERATESSESSSQIQNSISLSDQISSNDSILNQHTSNFTDRDNALYNEQAGSAEEASALIKPTK